jgi:AcrR family transcriptional regulator
VSTASTRGRGELHRASRRAALLAAAARRFDQVGYEGTTMAEVAADAGVSKGATYLYFPSKESLFLKLLVLEAGGWATVVTERLDASRGRSARAIARLLAGELVDRPRLLRLLALLHPVLEAGADAGSILDFRRALLARLLPLASRLEQRLAELRSGEGVRLLLRLCALAVGLGPLASSPAGVREAVAADPALAALEPDFERELTDCVTALIDGWR